MQHFGAFYSNFLNKKEQILSNYSKTKLKIHPKEGLEMETYATPFIKTAIGIAIILIALAILALGITPLFNVLIELMK